MKRLLMVFSLLLLTFAAQAQTKPRLVVWQKNGEKVYYELENEPETRFSGSYLIIKTNSGEIYYQLSNVARYTFEGVANGLELLPSESAVQMSREQNTVTFKNLQAGSVVQLYAANGTLIETRSAVAGMPLVISFANQPSGVYIIKNGGQTIKMLRP